MLEGVENVFLSDERHFVMDLCELRLPVSSQFFVSEALYDLEVAVHASDHEDLLEDLRRLGEGVELAGVHSRRNDKITRTLWCRFD